MDFFGVSGLSLAGRAEPLPDIHSGMQPISSTPSINEENSSPKSSLQRSRLHANAVGVTLIKNSAAMRQASFPLKAYHWQTYFDILSHPAFSHLVKRTIDAQQKTLYWLINEQRAQKYLNQCYDKLKQGFRDYLVKIQEERLSPLI